MSEYGCKVCRVLADHDLEDHEEKLLEQWLAEGSQRKGYRQLAEWLNVTLLRRAMDREGLSTLGDEAASKYERLRAEDRAVAEEVRTDLANAGVDIDHLEADFVSYGVVRTHLKECLDAEREHEPSDWEEESIRIAADRTREKVAEAIRSLNNKGDLAAGGDISVNVRIELECENCFTRVPVDRAIRRGHVCQK